MTAEGSPNHDSEKSNSAQEQQHFVYDGPNTELQYDADYVPEREFVLMPLFRRIGDMLRIRRRTEDAERIYAPGLAIPHASEAEPDHLSTPATEVREDEHELSPPPFMRAEVEAPVASDSDVLGIEHEYVSELPTIDPEPVLAGEIPEPEAEPVMTAREVQTESEPVIVNREQSQPERVVAHATEESPTAPIVASDEERAVPSVELVAAKEVRPQPAPPRPVLTQEDIAQLIAPITEAAREAAAKISAAMSQAAEWLHTKEEEILRRAELTVESRRTGVVQASPANTPKWEAGQTAALRGQAVWHESGGIAVTRGKQAGPAGGRPATVKPKRPALWKRIDWAQEFTPKRVAVLGGVAMAMLLVVGVSLARRPASSVLPQPQQATHVIQPGGVTLTTHPRTTAPATTQVAPQRKSSPHPQTAATQSSRRMTYEDGPDVVTHYYGKQKPSPVHQSTVAGVKHYSDMESR